MRKNTTTHHPDPCRLYKTPSPPNSTQFNSPRLVSPANPSNATQTPISKSGQHPDVFKAYLLQTKQKQPARISQNGEMNAKKYKLQKNQENNGKKLNSADSEPYNTYFLPQLSSNMQDRREKNNHASQSSSRKTSVSRQSLEPSQAGSRNYYQQTIRKLANENIKLRHECKVIQERYEKISQQCKIRGQQNTQIKFQLETLESTCQQAIKKQNQLNQQVKSLKKLLKLCSEELSQSNFESYQMKQQISELKLQLSKPQPKEYQGNSYPLLQTWQAKKEQVLASVSGDQKAICIKCKRQAASISQLIDQNEKTKFQLAQKIKIANSLRTEVQNLEQELKTLEKPRQIYKKFNTALEQLSQQLVREKARQLNFKYMKLIK